MLIENCLVFSRASSGNKYLAPNFQVKEFACKDGSDPVFINPLIPVVCQIVRNWFGYAFEPNSAYRTITHNKSEKGAANSLHIFANAVDIPAHTGKASPKQLYDFLDRLCGNTCEIGLYNWGVHFALTKKKKRFTDSAYKGG